jgi:hypothetical protein
MITGAVVLALDGMITGAVVLALDGIGAVL